MCTKLKKCFFRLSRAAHTTNNCFVGCLFFHVTKYHKYIVFFALKPLGSSHDVLLVLSSFRFLCTGRPGPPSAPIKFEEVGAEKITLSWLPPKDDGGSKVTNYVIWRRVANRKTWVPVTSEPKDRIWTVENLMEGHEYVFRIMAQNKYGVGEPLDSEPEVARNRYSESNCWTNHTA